MRNYKKYPNRRLYDLDNSKYVTIDDVRQSLLCGDSIQVIESSDGKDITRAVLLQILSEQEEEGHEAVLTNRAIEQIIRFYDQRFGRFVSSYIEQSMLLFLEHQDQYREQMRNLTNLNPMNAMRQAMDMWASAGGQNSTWESPNKESPNKEDPNKQKDED
ncbi:MAG TPA: polyhydroxyalkanoate synthesis repressor PhaR [Gammaproteobacteria bacterium]|nr:polyhydroxyalkanoate synthesis repressor PhaR [Gammaproteobacteria bacterium]|tara:strand:+ start:719 stop:1198 length:480 start_codon:yes stop_codon:yes gene_type:complete